MKKLLLLSVIALFSAYAGDLFAELTTVRVFSSNFAVSGEAWCGMSCGEEGEEYPGHLVGSYDESGPVPVSGTVGQLPWYFASSSADFFSVYASASLADSAIAYASAEWIFSPLSMMNSLAIHAGDASGANLSYYTSYNVKLADLTDATDI